MSSPPAVQRRADPRRLTRLAYEYIQQKQGTPWDLAPRARDLGDPGEYLEATRLYRTLLRAGHTMISARRGRMLHDLARRVEREGVPGALVDCGVWNGGSTILLHHGAPSRDVWAFDSFEGLPEPGALDGPESAGWQGECLGSEEKLRAGFARFGDPARLNVVKGWFQDTFGDAAANVSEVAILHVDGDWYESVLLTLRTFYQRISPGGWIVLDDYGHWIGARRATDDFRREVGDDTPMVRVDYAGRCWRKP
jgi:O-methyltransferase